MINDSMIEIEESINKLTVDLLVQLELQRLLIKKHLINYIFYLMS